MESVPQELSDVAIRFIQLLVLWIGIARALEVLGADAGWLTLLILVALLVAVFVGKPFLDGMVSSVVVAASAVSVGDEIGVAGVRGEVIGIAKRNTVMKTRDGLNVYIPNSEIIEETVTVFNAYDERRSSVDVSVAFDTDLDRLDRLITNTLQSCVSITRLGSVWMTGFARGVEVQIDIWHHPSLSSGDAAVDEVVRSLSAAFTDGDIQLISSVRR
jgi:small-conductance mechanosensitive channel